MSSDVRFERGSPAAPHPAVTALVATALAMALCGAAFRLLQGRDGALALALSIGAVTAVTAGLLVFLRRILGPQHEVPVR